MKTLTTLEQLDEKLAECDAAGNISDTALRQVFSTFRMDFSHLVPSDPFSAEYRNVQMDLYRRLSGITYEVKNEKTKFDVAKADRQPFPYYTGSCKTVGFFTMGVGSLLHHLNVEPGARVLEFGVGWGNTTIAMALSGLRMTAVDIESDFCDLLKLRAKRHELDINVVNADFMWAETVTEPFDAAIFFESFHHCSDHMRLLRALQTAIKPGGKVYFGAEPIVGDFPIPWGLRMDGESLWAIRANKWLELGFNESYFREALERTGWIAVKHSVPGLGWAAVWEAVRPHEADAQFLAAQAAALPTAVANAVAAVAAAVAVAAPRPIWRRAASRLRSTLFPPNNR